VTERFEFVSVRYDGGVAVVEMNRPDKRNAMNVVMLEELRLALEHEEASNDVSAVVLTGRGAVFSSGADRGAVEGMEGDALAQAFAPVAIQIASGVARLMLRMVTMNKPIVGAINGHAVGGALIVALGCDLRVAADHAVLWMPEIGMGRAIGAPSMATLIACAGPLVAKEIVLTSKRFTAQQMAAMQLVNRVAAGNDVVEIALELARSLAVLDGSAVATVKSRANAELAKIWAEAQD